MFTCYSTADIEGSSDHGQEKTDSLSTVNVRLGFSILLVFFVCIGGCPCAQEGFLT